MKTIVKAYFGSHLYGTSTPESDVDFKEIFVPSAKEILLGTMQNQFNLNTNNTATKNSQDDVDHELFSLKYFLKLASNGETVALDMLHTPQDLIVKSDLPEVWNFIQKNRSRFYTTSMESYLGYVRKQAGKYGVKGSRLADLRSVLEFIQNIPEWKHPNKPQNKRENVRWKIKDIAANLPTGEFIEWLPFVDHKLGEQLFYVVLGRKFQDTLSIEEFKYALTKLFNEYGERARKAEANEGIDWKALSHALRGGYQLLEIYETGDLKYPLSMASQLKSVKAGECDFKHVQHNLEHVVDAVEKASAIAAKNGMPEHVDMSFWDKFLEEVYLDELNSWYK